MSKYKDNDGCGSCLLLLLCGVIAIIIVVSNGGSNHSNNSSRSSYSSGSTYGRPWKKKLQEYEREKAERKRQEQQLKEIQQNAQRYQSVPVYTQPSYSSEGGGTHRGTPRENYRILWEECEDLEAILDDHNIDHESLSYPMDYHDLEDLRDEYQSLLEDNGIDY